ncbi:MAG TPA: abscisic acid-deficient protein Aba4 family protein [Allosphingosinicella sp.]|jgi:hypothetical protein
MTLETWFWIAHVPTLAGWAALFFAWSRGVPFARWAAVTVAIGYAIVFLLAAREAGALARDYSLAGVAAFFDVSMLQLLGWIHYLAFDLFVGSWIVEEGQRLGISRALIAPCLILTLMLGPLGLLLFFVIRSTSRNSIAS